MTEGPPTSKPPDGTNEKKVKINSSQKEIFLQEAIHYLTTRGGIATIEEMFKIAERVWGKYSWTKTKLEKIRDILVQSNRALQIDIAVPHPKPVKIYEGRHKVQRTIFFALPTEDFQTSIERAKSILQGMTTHALQLEKEKSKMKKRQHQDPKNVENISNESQTPQDNQEQDNEATNLPQTSKNQNKKSLECNNPLYISSRYHQAQILHFFIISTFGTKIFTILELFKCFSVDLYLKLFNGLTIPEIFVKEPHLRYILLPYLPKRYQELFSFEKAPNTLAKILKFLCNTLKILINPTPDSFQACSCVSITFPNKLNCIYDVSIPEGVIKFWKAYIISDLYESSDATGSSFLKHYSIKPISSNTFLVASIRNILYPLNYNTFPFNFFSVSNLIEKLGINWVFLKNSLLSLNLTKNVDFNQLWNDSLASKVCQSPISTFNSKLYTLRKIDIIPDEKFEAVIKNIEPRTALAFLAAYSEISTGNYFLEGNHPWSKIDSLFQQYSDNVMANSGKEHLNLYKYYNDYRDLYNEIRAFFLANPNIAESHYFNPINFSDNNFDDSQNSLEQNINNNQENILMTVQEINKSYKIWKLGRKMPPYLGELVERLKIVLFSQKYGFPSSVLTRFLYEIDVSDSSLQEAILFLQLCGFLFLSHEKLYTFHRIKLMDLTPFKDITHFKNLNKVDRYFKLYTLSKFNLEVSSILGTSSSLIYLLTQENEFYFDTTILESNQTFHSLTNSQTLSSFVKQIIYSFDENIVPYISYFPFPSIKFITDSNENQESNSEKNIKTKQTNDKQKVKDSSQNNETDKKGTYIEYPINFPEMLQNDFLQLFSIAYQSSFEEKYEIILIYGYIYQKQVKGCSLEDIFTSFTLRENIIVRVLRFLQQFHFILEVSSLTLTPHFVAGPFMQSHEPKLHYWCFPNGDINYDILIPLSSRIMEIITNNNGIEFQDLAENFSSVSIHDLLIILEMLESQESIAIKDYEVSESNLFEEEIDITIQKLDNYLYLWNILQVQKKLENQKKFLKKIYCCKNSDILIAKGFEPYIVE